MKRLLLLLITVSTALFVNAEKITEQQALEKAKLFFSGKQFQVANKTKRLKPTAEPTVTKNLYVFNVVDNGGFVIVSGDDRTKSILGYSDKGNLDLNNLPSNVKWWLDCYDKAIAALAKNPKTRATDESETERDSIAPFIKTQWGQGEPYNAHCPQIDGKNTLTGCIATAMAQVINYTKCPEGAVGSMSSYTTNTNKIGVKKLDGRTFDWSNMSEDDIAWLMRYCGQAVGMDYGLDNSGAYDVNIPAALVGKFGFDGSTHLVNRNDNYDDWDALMYREMKAGRPVIYSGQSYSGIGHSFICDGYKSGLYHINWGWAGLYDGYFDITVAQPAEESYSNSQTAVVGIRKVLENGEPDINDTTVVRNAEEYLKLKFSIINDHEVSVEAAEKDITGVINIPSKVVLEGSTYSVTLVKWPGFWNCLNITEVNLAEGIEDISSGAFENCKRLKKITIPKSFIGNMQFIECFIGCDSLNEIVIDDNNPNFKYEDGSIMSKDGRILHVYAGGRTAKEYVIPNRVEKLSQAAFRDHRWVEKVILNSKIKEISNYAFFECHSLKTVNLTNNVGNIGFDAFGKSSIAYVDLPDSLRSIDEYAFEQCKNLRSITLPAALESIGRFSFSDCTSLDTIIVKKATPITIGEDVFSDSTYQNATLFIPKGRLEYYQGASAWGKFIHIQEIDMPDVVISSDPFDNIGKKQMLFGYYRDNQYAKKGSGGKNIGTYKVCAGFSKGSMMPFEGNKITYARFALVSDDIKDVKFWIGSTRDLKDIVCQDVKDVKIGWNVVTLEKPYSITGDSIFMGIEYYSEKQNNYPLAFGNDFKGSEKGSFLIYGPYNDGISTWKDISEDYAFSIQCIIDGDKIPDSYLHVVSGGISKYNKIGEECEAGIGLKNWGKGSVIDDFVLAISIDGKEVYSTDHSELWEVPDYNYGGSFAFKFKIPDDYSPGIHNVRAYVKSVKGKDQISSNLDNSSLEKVILYKQDIGRQKRLKLYYTSTWCPHTTNENVYYDVKKHPEYALVSLYWDQGTELWSQTVKEYWQLNKGGYIGMPGYDRYFESGSQMKQVEPSIWNYPASANVQIESAYDETRKILNIKVKGQRISEFTSIQKYTNLTVFLTEDDVIYPQYDGDTETYITDFHHQGVLRANVSEIWGDPVVWDGDNYEMTYTYRLKDEWNKDNMHIVAFLGKPFTGSNYDEIEVVNCNDFAVKDAEVFESSTDSTFVEQQIGYKVNADNTVSVTDNSDKTGDVVIPEKVSHNGATYSVTSIASNAFQDNVAMTSVSIPDCITAIGEHAFSGCTGLNAIYVYAANPIPLNAAPRTRASVSSVFSGVDKDNCILYVPDGSVNLYKDAEGWREFHNILPLSATGISVIKIDKEMPEIYNLRGQKVGNNSNSLNGLPKGVYIMNGKKVIK